MGRDRGTLCLFYFLSISYYLSIYFTHIGRQDVSFIKYPNEYFRYLKGFLQKLSQA